MNKIAIPALLVATIMVAGAFAFVPVEQASTVHTTVIDDVSKVVVASTVTCTMTGAAGGNCDLLSVTIPAGSNALLLSTLTTYTNGVDTGDDTVDFAVLTINGAVSTVDLTNNMNGVGEVQNVSGVNWGIQGAGAGTITSAGTIAGLDDDDEAIQTDIFMLVTGTTTGISAAFS